MARVVIESWRFLPHSYALWAQHLALQLLGREGVEVRFVEAPIPDARWSPRRGVLDSAQEELLAAIPAPTPGDVADLWLRVKFPYDFSPAPARRVVVAGTSEYGVVPTTFVAGGRAVGEAARESGFTIATCSGWSRDGFLRSGVKAKQMADLPCGVDTRLFRPADDAARAALRRRLGWEGSFVLFHSSSLGWNKGLEYMLEAVLALAGEMPALRLAIKGVDALYSSSAAVEVMLSRLPPGAAEVILPRLQYVGGSMTSAEVAELYHAADAYVAPYLAEGFNLPVLEAAACGLPVICTGGGSTDDFTRPDFALRIASAVVPTPAGSGPAGGRVLRPDLGSFVGHIRRVAKDGAWRARAREAGPAFVAGGWTWAHAADKLMALVPKE